MFDLKEASEILLSQNPSDVVKYKIVTNFRSNDSNPEIMMDLRRKVNCSKWVQDIKNEQHCDGGWGRFHSQDSKVKQKYKTTESAVLYLYALGLKRGDEIIDKACIHMENMISDLSLWPDAWEKNKWFKPAVPLFIISRLALFNSENPHYTENCLKWIYILQNSFQNGLYDGSQVDRISKRVLGVNIHGKYIGLNSINNIILFAHIKDKIPVDIQRRYLQWLHCYPETIFYTNTRLYEKPERIKNTKELSSWIHTMRIVSLFDGFYEEFNDEIEWLINRQGEDDLWDFGTALSSYKLSDNWRSNLNKKIDHTTYVLEILYNALK
ncbi:hypothetical protein ACS127_03130 [Amphibacillus sp. Q70]|uniref:hypothetical protein n=1 Tax=Amphibacillus sp. Q70 TaxID=3453416 RepID=UPI003F87C151